VFENHAVPPGEAETRRHLEHMARETRGLEALEGTYPFTLERSVKAYRINKFLHTLVDPAARAAFRADEGAALRAAGLSDVERDLLARRDWRALMHYGVIFFLLEKLAAVSGLSNLHVYAAMRGQSMSDFQKTRNAPNAVYSVSGRDAPAAKPRG